MSFEVKPLKGTFREKLSSTFDHWNEDHAPKHLSFSKQENDIVYYNLVFDSVSTTAQQKFSTTTNLICYGLWCFSFSTESTA